MFNSKFNGILTILLIVAIVGILGLIGYFGWSVYNKYYIDSSAKNAVNAFEQVAANNKKNEVKNEAQDEGERGQIDGVEGGSSIYQNQTSSNNTTKYEGYDVYGTISIPKIKIEYPILESATPKAIKVAVGYVAGVGVNKVGNTIISGHNYRNGLFFSNLKKLNKGDKIYITDPSRYKSDI